MVYPLVVFLLTYSISRVPSIIELTVDEDSLNNMFGDLGDETTVVVESCPKAFNGFGKQLPMEIGSYVSNPVSFKVTLLMGLCSDALFMCSSVACPFTHEA